MAFQKRHYEMIARRIDKTRDEFPLSNALLTLGQRLADDFAADNPRFDRARFLRACGIEASPEPQRVAYGRDPLTDQEIADRAGVDIGALNTVLPKDAAWLAATADRD
jgi:hypothetical protein